MAYFTCQNLGIFKEYRDFGPMLYQNVRLITCQNRRVFQKNHIFDAEKNPWPIFACRNLGTFKKYKDIGLTSYRNFRISTCHNLAVFQHFKRAMFLSPKTHLTPVEILGYFLRTRLFTPKTHCLCGLSTSWAAFEEYRNNNNNNNKQAFKRRISNRKETQCAEQVDKSSKQMYTRCRETT